MQSLHRILALIVKEFVMVLKDPKSRFVIIGPPLIQFFVFGYAATYDLNNVRYAVLDESRGSLSRQLLARVEGSGIFRLTANLLNEKEIATVIDNEEARLVIHIGPEFDRDLHNKIPVTVQVIADGRNPNVALIALGYIANMVERFNQTLLQERYPEAAVTPFSGPTGRSLAVQSVYRGELDAFLGDDILTISEVLGQGLSAQNLTLVPELPLSCEYYGLVLPQTDPQWVKTVDRFLAAEVGQQTWKQWLGQYTPYALDTLSYCLNR